MDQQRHVARHGGVPDEHGADRGSGANAIQPARTGGFVYSRVRSALVEYAGNHSAERFNHIHMWQDDPLCAQIWYQTHLNASVPAGRASGMPLTEANCRVPRGAERSWPALNREGMFRNPRAAVEFGDVGFFWYARQSDELLVSHAAQLQDHVALGVATSTRIAKPGAKA